METDIFIRENPRERVLLQAMVLNGPTVFAVFWSNQLDTVLLWGSVMLAWT